MRSLDLKQTGRFADLANFAFGAGGDDLGDTGAAHDQRPGKYKCKIVATRTRRRMWSISTCRLAHRHGFSCKQGFVSLKIFCGEQPRIGGHPVTLGQHDQVAPHYLTSGNAQTLSIPNHQRPRTRQVAQRFHDPLRAGLLHDGNHHRETGEGEQDGRFPGTAKRQIYHAAANQQRQHGFTNDLQDDAQRRTPVRLRKLIEPFALKSGSSICGTQTAQFWCS